MAVYWATSWWFRLFLFVISDDFLYISNRVLFIIIILTKNLLHHTHLPTRNIIFLYNLFIWYLAVQIFYILYIPFRFLLSKLFLIFLLFLVPLFLLFSLISDLSFKIFLIFSSVLGRGDSIRDVLGEGGRWGEKEFFRAFRMRNWSEGWSFIWM